MAYNIYIRRVIIINTKLFIEEILKPLEKKLHVNIYLNVGDTRNEWNNNCPKIKRGEKCNGCISTNRCDKTGRKICIHLQGKSSEIISALFHEIGHVTMHNIYNRYEDNPIFCEAEAEEFAKIMCKKTSIPYNPNFKDEPDINFINYFWNLYTDYCSQKKHKKREIRYNLIEKISNEILNYNLDYKKFL